MTQFEFYKSFLFVIELLAAEFIYLHRLRRKKYFLLRAAIGTFACFVFAFFLPVISNDAFYCSLLFLLIFSFVVLMCKMAFNESWLTVIFCCLAGYTTQHLSYEMYNAALTLMNISANQGGFYGSAGFTEIFPNLFVFTIYIFIYVMAYCLCYFFFGTKINKGEEIVIESTFIFVFTIFILVIDIVLNAIVVYNPVPDGQLYVIIIGMYNILCCFVSLYLQFEVALRREIEKKVDVLQEMLNQARKQYALSKENIDLINMKCHDFKHQIHALGGGQTVSPVALKELEDSISIYDSIVKTGNDALDIILTEKSLLCNKQKIRFSCMIDGEKLNFMKKEDTYALFGNIVDNAIEAVSKVEPEKRTISLRVKMLDGMIAISASNYFNRALLKKDGVIQTTKADKKNHGYGIKSIRYICENYGGDVNIVTDEDIFTINLLFFPQKPNDAQATER